MTTYKIALWACTLLLTVSSCKDNYVEPIEKDGIPPQALQDVKTESLPGAIKFTYTLPSDPDLLYVLARYTNKKGKVLEFKSSFYTNTLTVEGFGDTDTYLVELYAVDRSENRSAVKAVSVTPLTPPILQSYESLRVIPDFGGMTFSMDNRAKSELVIQVCTLDQLDEMGVIETFYTSRADISYSIRGYEDTPRSFGIFIKDKYGNETDTLFTSITPIYERELDKKLFRELFLLNDTRCTYYDGKMEYIWDGRAASDSDGSTGCHTGAEARTEPTFFTFDLGVLAKLSRFNLQAIQDEKHYYNDMSPRLYEVWGCVDEPNPDGSWDQWFKLLSMENVKPSGSPTGILTDDDISAGKLGDGANVPLDTPSVRYIRIKCLKNWSSNYNMCFTELTFWGNDKEMAN